MVNKEKLNLFEEKEMGMGISKGKGHKAQSQRIGPMMVAPGTGVSPYMQPLAGRFCLQWVLGAWLVGLDSGVGLTRMQMFNPVLLGSPSSLYGLTPSIWHFLSLFSCGGELTKWPLRILLPCKSSYLCEPAGVLQEERDEVVRKRREDKVVNSTCIVYWMITIGLSVL